MSRIAMGRAARAGALTLAVVAVASGCATSSDKPVAGAKTVDVALTGAGCAPSVKSIAAGPVTFAVSNKATGAVTEAELQTADSSATILGEKENVAPGLSGTFSLTLKPGSYKLYCPGGSTDGYTNFMVTGTAPSSAPVSPAVSAALTAATTGYADYIRDQVGQLVANTKTFTDAVRADNLAAAAAAYPLPRVFYERVEPVAEAFTVNSSATGNLDADIDNRIDDVMPGQTFTGFHALEQAIFQKRSLAGTTPIANMLDTDVNELKTLVATQTYQPAQVANGATELLDEVGATKITGEEERYSHIDIVDFVGNVAGSEKAYDLLSPGLKLLDPTLESTVTKRFAALDSALAAYSTGSGPTDYKSYSDLTKPQLKALGALVDAVAEPLSQVAGTVVSA